MRYLPHTQEDIDQMLGVLGLDSLDALFSTIPSDCRRSRPLDLPDAMTEWEILAHLEGLAGAVAAAPGYKLYVGAGSYDHYIPSVVSHLAGRSEFVTAYTPYQPEMAQGTLQGIFEFQTLVCRLLGMEVANASVYDGASALAEALLMAIRITRCPRVAISTTIHPLYRRVVQTYFRPTDYEIVELPYTQRGLTDVTLLKDSDRFAAVAVQSPNFFGCIENLAEASARAKATQALLIAAFTEPLAYGLLKNPGSLGADIACGEGQSLGIARSFGGPGLGLLAGKLAHVRNMPGRLIGQTADTAGRRGFVLTLATREQHIRREKATSNICTNNSLCALTAAMYMAALGRTGIKQLARRNYDLCAYLRGSLESAGIRVPFDAPGFNELVVRLPEETYAGLLEKKIVAGIRIERYYPELKDHSLVCVTETASKQDIDQLVKELSS